MFIMYDIRTKTFVYMIRQHARERADEALPFVFQRIMHGLVYLDQGAVSSYLWLVGNGGMGYNYNYYYYHSSIPY